MSRLSCPKIGLNQIKAGHGAFAGGEVLGFDSLAVEEAHEEVWERVVFLLVEGEVLAVTEAAAGEEDGHVAVVMRAGVA